VSILEAAHYDGRTSWYRIVRPPRPNQAELFQEARV